MQTHTPSCQHCHVTLTAHSLQVCWLGIALMAWCSANHSWHGAALFAQHQGSGSPTWHLHSCTALMARCGGTALAAQHPEPGAVPPAATYMSPRLDAIQTDPCQGPLLQAEHASTAGHIKVMASVIACRLTALQQAPVLGSHTPHCQPLADSTQPAAAGRRPCRPGLEQHPPADLPAAGGCRNTQISVGLCLSKKAHCGDGLTAPGGCKNTQTPAMLCSQLQMASWLQIHQNLVMRCFLMLQHCRWPPCSRRLQIPQNPVRLCFPDKALRAVACRRRDDRVLAQRSPDHLPAAGAAAPDGASRATPARHTAQLGAPG